MREIITHDEKETETLAENIAKKLNGTEIFAFEGNLGAGKTAFTRGLAKGLGVKEDVSSPTFAILNEYTGKHKLFHFDMYRISNFDDLFSTGFFDMLGKGIFAIEWSENIEGALPVESIKIRIEYGKNKNERIFRIEGLDF